MIKQLQILFLVIISSTLFADQEPNKVIKVKKELKIDIAKTYHDKDTKKILRSSISTYKKGDQDIEHGPSMAFYKNGAKKIIINYSHGKKDGEQKYWREDKTTDKILYWKKGELTKKEIFHLNGILKTRSTFTGVKGVKHLTHFYKNGIKKLQFTIIDKKVNGIRKMWTKKGILESEDEWKDNKRNGKMKAYYVTGQLKVILEWKDNKIIGERVSYNKNKTITAKCIYKEGIPHKGSVFDNENFEIRNYKNGKLTETNASDEEGNLR
ncbi:MAG: hypothetical protein COA79_15290 [Planctomycetota bacterium]|nr:MAG: hypothetical protein COA79_15290 [Planctomycetota bacterium]